MNENDIGFNAHSKKIMASYSMGNLVFHLVDGIIVFVLFFFYESEVGLSSWLTALGLVIYAIWDAFNDPLVGYLTDRPFKFTKKRGRRYPWIMLAYIPWIISFLLIFTPPNVDNQWTIFGWLVGTLCLYDFLESVVTVNLNSLFPDKFRGRSERLTASAFTVYIGFIGVVLAFLLPPILIVYGNIGTYALLAWVCVLISFICGIFMIPGVKDDKDKVERYLAKYDEGRQRESFFKVLKQTLKQKSFVIFLIMYILYLSLTHLMTGSLLYFVSYVLKAETTTLLIMTLLLLIGGLISIPFWLKLNHKLGDNRKTMIIAGIMMACSALPFAILENLTFILITIFLFGFGVGGYWVMIEPVFSQVIDESVVKYEQRREGIYNGIRIFFSRAAVAIQAITLAIVHELTGFAQGSETQTPLALIGIHIHMGLIPAMFMATGILVFWKFFDITPEKAKQYKEKIIEIGL